MRNAAVAGKFYPDNVEELKHAIHNAFLHIVGPGRIGNLNISGPRHIVGGVVPHASYFYSGAVAAHFYNALAEDGFPESFIIIGPNHFGVGAGVATTDVDFQTPLGIVKNNVTLTKQITKDIIYNDIEAHLYEHSIEVQLPFLQFFKSHITFVPIVMLDQSYETAIKVGDIIRDAISGKDVVVIASSDFSHYVQKNIAYKKDALLIERIVKNDLPGIYNIIYRYNITACGYGPITAMLRAVRGTPTLLKYATSGDIAPMAEVVGYSAIKVEKEVF